jgi:AraC-like DNA-binding protein
MPLKIKQRSIFLKLFVSYILIILVISSLISTMVFSYSRYNLEREVTSLNNSVLEQYAKIAEALVLSRTEKIIIDFTVNTGFVQQLARLAYAGDKAIIPNYTIYQQLLEIVRPNQNFIKGIHLYNPYTDTLISSIYGIKPVLELPALIRSNLDWISETEEKSKSLKEDWIPVREQRYSQLGEKVRIITYIREVQLIRTDLHPPLIVAVDILEDNVIDVLQKHTAVTGETFFLTDGKGGVQFQLNRPLPVEDLQLLLSNYPPEIGVVQRAVIEGVEYITSYFRISNGWYLYRLVPLQYFFKASNQLILNTILISVLLIFLGGVLAYYLSKYFYTPIATIENRIMMLVGSQGKSSDGSNDEFIHINNALNDLDETLSTYYQEQERKIPRLKNDFIRNALYGNYLDEETYHHHRELVNALSPDSYCAVLLVHFLPNPESNFNRNRIAQSKLSGIDLIERQSNKNILFLGTDLNDLTLAFLCYGSKSESASYGEDKNRFIKLYGLFTANINEKTYFSHGSFQADYSGINHSYKEALQAQKHRFFYPDRFIFSPRLIQKNMDYDAVFFEKQNDKLKKALLSEQYDSAREVIEKTVSFLIKEAYSYITKELCLHTMTQIIQGELFKLKLSDEILLEEQLTHYRNISNIREFNSWCDDIVELFKINRSNNKDEYYTVMVRELREYIDTHLSDDLSLTRLADRMKLSNGYLSRIFLDITGIPLNEYITRTRMENARVLLKSTDRKIADIAQESGFYTPHYFSKKFKEYYGKTPLNYRLTEKEKDE